ncbi:sensor histidine kinase [Chitinophaga solisilvae]|uniref:sensor histidine kinase n=1 Tax=Chitinophaga solisilvae TaxID=1233460 RepID=UPI00137207B6|nr:histidine kinase [Chitinophaga solisilvae]
MPVIENIVNFSNRRRILAHCLLWAAIFIWTMIRHDSFRITDQQPFYTKYDTLYKEVLCVLLDISFAMIGAYFVSYRILPALMKATNYFWILVEFLVGVYIICTVARITTIYLLEPVVRTPPFDQEPILEILTDFRQLFRNYFISIFSVSILFIFLKLIKDQYVSNKRTLEQEKKKTEIELTSLKAQLNPHFLFNTLNNIYSLSLMNAPQTSTSIARLSDILDHLLYRCSGKFVPVSQEINLLHNYIELEKLRYDDRLQITFRHNTETEAHIAPLILLSLVENAFKHGAGEDAGSPAIKISLEFTRNIFSFEVKNTFRNSATTKDSSNQIGLTNIRKQLELIYPGSHIFLTNVEDGVFTAHLQIMMKEKK